MIFWANWMIDWPREHVQRHLVDGSNLALVARRQMPPSQPCCYFWITDTVALDGLIRSDNRGSESVFPLYLLDDVPAAEARSTPSAERDLAWPSSRRRPNFSQDFIAALEARLKLAWDADAAAPASDRLAPVDLCHYIYALFHSPDYRRRYANWLHSDFPRVLLPRQASLFRQLAERRIAIGCQPPATPRHGIRSVRRNAASRSADQARVSEVRAGTDLVG